MLLFQGHLVKLTIFRRSVLFRQFKVFLRQFLKVLFIKSLSISLRDLRILKNINAILLRIYMTPPISVNCSTLDLSAISELYASQAFIFISYSPVKPDFILDPPDMLELIRKLGFHFSHIPSQTLFTMLMQHCRSWI